ncbi:hypothetical protein [Rhizobium sp.]|uniref:hypothetical protein n=1 Tax=Rhizobium sp. TaxID=391 RepID=UPI00389B2111
MTNYPAAPDWKAVCCPTKLPKEEQRAKNGRRIATLVDWLDRCQQAEHKQGNAAHLISTVDARLHVGELRFAAELTDAGALAEELKDFRRTVSAAGRASFNARQGKHDDLILSIAIALWWASRPRTGGGQAAISGFY